MGDMAGHGRHIVAFPVACTLNSHCAIAPVLMLSRGTIPRWDPGDLRSWLPCNCLACCSSIPALKQGHFRCNCREERGKKCFSFHIKCMEFKEIFVSVTNRVMWNTTIYDAPYLALGGDIHDGNSHQELPLCICNTRHEWWPLGESEGLNSDQVWRPRLFSHQYSWFPWSHLCLSCRFLCRKAGLLGLFPMLLRSNFWTQ